MTTAHLKIIALGVLALVVIWAGTALLPSGTDRPTADVRLPAIVADSVDTIRVTTRAETVTVARDSAGGWSVNGFGASGPSVDEFFAATRDTVQPELVSQSAASFGRLGLDTAAARRLTITARGRVVLDLLVSERNAAAGGAYVRWPGDSAAYVWLDRLGTVVRRRADDWRDHGIGTVNRDSVRRVNVERGRRSYSLRRRDGRWVFVRGRSADSGAVARLLDHARAINADGFPTRAQLDSAFRGRPERRVALFGSADTALLALEFDSTAGGFWVRRTAGGTVYRVSTWQADQLAPADSTLRRRAQ